MLMDAGLAQNMSPRKLRHFLLTWLKKQGIDDALIQPYSGHESRKSLEIYSKLSIADAQEEYNKTISVKAIKDRDAPQRIIFGYLKDGEYFEYKNDNYSLQGYTDISFTASEAGKYCIFLINASSDTIYVNSCTISA